MCPNFQARRFLDIYKQVTVFSFTVFERILGHTYVFHVTFSRVGDKSMINHVVDHAVALQGADCVFSAVALFVDGSFTWCRNFRVV